MISILRHLSYRAIILLFVFSLLSSFNAVSQETPPTIEVNGSASISIIPDRITIEISMEEYRKHLGSGDSVIVKLSEIEKQVRRTLKSAGVPDSAIIISDIGNFRNREETSEFLMAERLSATVTNFKQLDEISKQLDRKGITGFYITSIDNSDKEAYNRQGLKAALDAAREKAEFIAQNEGLKITMPYEIIENTPTHFDTPAYSNVSFDRGSGMDNVKRIIRRYSVRVKYLFTQSSDRR